MYFVDLSAGQRFEAEYETFHTLYDFAVNFRREVDKITFVNLPSRRLATIYTPRDYSEIRPAVRAVESSKAMHGLE
jgi:hypothetical protein